MKRIYDYEDYKKYLRDRVSSLPKQGWGELQKIARYLKIHPTLMSQIFRGEKDLTMDQACDLCEYLGLNESEGDFFLKLVQYQRLGTQRAKERVKRQITKLREEGNQVTARLPAEKKLTEADRAVFYSHWSYSGVRLATSIDHLSNCDAIAERLNLPRNRVLEILEFLVSQGLCLESSNRIKMGPKTTHIPSTSPLVYHHHANWRVKAMQTMDALDQNDLFFSAPVSLAKKDIPKLRKLMVNFIEEVINVVKASPAEELACFNLDWFQLR